VSYILRDAVVSDDGMSTVSSTATLLRENQLDAAVWESKIRYLIGLGP
jgi:hypothetical protein